MAPSERAQFGTGHSPDEHGHQPGRHLIVGNFVVGVGADQECDFVGGEFAAIALLADEVERAHACRSAGVRSVRLADWTSVSVRQEQGSLHCGAGWWKVFPAPLGCDVAGRKRGFDSISGMRLLVLLLASAVALAQRTPGSPLDHLPPNIEVLTHFGERADISPDNQRVAFMTKSFGDAMVVDLKSRVIQCLTCNVPAPLFCG